MSKNVPSSKKYLRKSKYYLVPVGNPDVYKPMFERIVREKTRVRIETGGSIPTNIEVMQEMIQDEYNRIQ